ncbi:MAG: hypothetical protein U1F29_08865 [Planctomycetota bacterium]
MSINKFALTGLIALASLGMASKAMANGRNPGSLLLFPEFDNRGGDLTLLTVTNTNTGVNADGSDGSVKVEFVYIGKYGHDHHQLDCLEFNRTETLTANDTLSLITEVHNPQHEQGYVYAFAKDRVTGKAKVFNHLIGNLMTLESWDTLEYSMNPVVFKGIGNAQTGVTDLDNDNVRDLDGVEYEAVPEEILIPRFLGSGDQFRSELILIGLSGGAAFDTIADFWVYNDNEEAFSAQYQFRCWDRVRLDRINGVFTQDFLANSTNHAANEIVGASDVESGWMRVYGGTAFSTAEQILNPAVYAVLVERIAGYGAADLPFESVATQNNGDLLPRGIFGDPSGSNGDNQ